MGSGGHLSTILRHLRHLAGLGSAGVTPDGQLLERFLTLRDEDAFAALVGRHAPLVRLPESRETVRH